MTCRVWNGRASDYRLDIYKDLSAWMITVVRLFILFSV